MSNSTTIGNELAFPASKEFGLTKREWMATQLMIGILSSQSPVGESIYPIIAQNAVDMANSLIKALNREEEK